ncbi:MAG: prolyl-tRNA synthetase associated domain-containing protein [Bacteroidales bacterium]|nr:prolyl-tRNA synthetase associated domain-containing protein [Bacteroidales bacterium]
MNREENRKKVLDFLDTLSIKYELHEHPPLDTIEVALEFWKDIDSMHFKNLFFRNHKGNKHFLVIIKDTTPFDIHALEKKLKQGKLSFASETRLKKYMGVKPGSVSAFGLINDTEHHVHVFLDEQIKEARKVSFHPNDNTASVVISYTDFQRYINKMGNTIEYITP